MRFRMGRCFCARTNIFGASETRQRSRRKRCEQLFQIFSCKEGFRCYTGYMALGAQLPIRLEPDIEGRLEQAASRLGTTKSALLRLLAKTFVEQMVGGDGSVKLPPEWKTMLPAADRRSTSWSSMERQSGRGARGRAGSSTRSRSRR